MAIKIGIYNHLLGENIIRDATDEEIATIEAQNAETKTIKVDESAKVEADAIAKQALLDRLGITADEAALLLA